MLEIAFSYRRGGGAVEAEMTARHTNARQAGDPPASGRRLTLSAGGEPVQPNTGRLAPARANIPRERFCTVAYDGGLFAEPKATPVGVCADQPPIGFKFAKMESRTAVFDEACP
jgi:hypothetical protein